MSAAPAQIGVILAGGASRRLPGGKPAALLAGRPLLGHAVDLVRAAGLAPVVCARASTELPPVDAPTWTEPEAGPDHAPHPLAGVTFALERAAVPIVVVPVDLPFLPAPVLAALAGAPAPGAVLGVQGRPAALVAGLSPTLAPELRAAAMAGAPALRTLLSLGVQVVDLDAITRAEPSTALMNVNDPAALAAAEAIAGREPPTGLT